MSKIILHQYDYLVVLYDTLKHEIIVKAHDKSIHYYVTCALDDVERYISKCKSLACVVTMLDNLLCLTS